jgi:hypothetical protein
MDINFSSVAAYLLRIQRINILEVYSVSCRVVHAFTQYYDFSQVCERLK